MVHALPGLSKVVALPIVWYWPWAGISQQENSHVGHLGNVQQRVTVG
jgi:hypothetical protein